MVKANRLPDLCFMGTPPSCSYPDRTNISDSLRVAFEAEDFPLCLQPIIERIALPVATLGVELVGAISDADLEIVAGRNRLTVDRLLL
jgi:hypothetical protein